MLNNCPNPVEIQDIHFKLHCRLKIFDNKELSTFTTPHNLLACASRYGLLFVGSNSINLQVVQLTSLEKYTSKNKDILDYPYRNITLPSIPKHISVNCDNTTLAVVIEQNNCPVAIFFDVLSYYKENVQTLTSVRLSANPGTFVTEINWNPSIPTFFTACKSDGSLGIYELKGTSVEINEIPPAAEVSSFSWSPKGKQVAVGSKKGTITQYKPDLKPVRIINAPPLEEPTSLISLQWISNYQFIGVYQPSSEESQAKLIVVDAPKTGETVYTNYDDVCYSGSTRIPQFFMILQQHWNLLLVASSNSAELAVLGLTGPDTWTQWLISDSSRAELPLSIDRQETLPIGLAFDISNTKPYQWGESTIAPCPYVLILSHQGELCVFHLVNLKNVPSICTPPDPIQDQSGLNQFIPKPINLKSASNEGARTDISLQTALTQKATPSLQQMPVQMKIPVPIVSSQSNPVDFSFSTVALTTTTTLPAKNLFTFASPTTTQSFQGQPILFEGKQSQSASLFGGPAAVSLTKAPPNTQIQPLPDQITLTPINKDQIKSITDDKYSSIFSSLNNQQNSPLLPVQVKPIVIASANPVNKTPLEKEATIPSFDISAISKPTATTTSTKALINVPSASGKSQLTFKPKFEANLMSKSEIPPTTPKPANDSSKIDTETILKKMIKEECLSLEVELRAVIRKGKLINVDLGSEADKTEMLEIIQNLEEFLDEISEISVGEHAEIHTLKQNLVLSWAWYEEAISRYNTSKNEMMVLLIKSQPLDSATEKRYSDIKKLMYYIETQYIQVGQAVGEQWDKFQDYVKKTFRVQMPTMETIYQSMVRQNAILQKQEYIMKDIARQLKQRRRTSGGSLLLSMDNIHLQNELKRLQLDDDSKSGFVESAIAQSKKLSSSKSKKLRFLLQNRQVVHTTNIKPYVPSETFQSPSKRLSLLGAKMSPVPKLLEPKQIDFSQSTPLRNFNLGTIPSNSTQLELEAVKPLNFGISDPSSAKTTNIVPISKSVRFSFTPTTSSQLLSSNLPSAFVPAPQTVLASKEKTTSAFGIMSGSKTAAVTKPLFVTTSGPESQKPMTFGASSETTTKSNTAMFSFAPTTTSIVTSTITNEPPEITKPVSIVTRTVIKPTKTLITSSNITTTASSPLNNTTIAFSISAQTQTSTSTPPATPTSSISMKPSIPLTSNTNSSNSPVYNAFNFISKNDPSAVKSTTNILPFSGSFTTNSSFVSQPIETSTFSLATFSTSASTSANNVIIGSTTVTSSLFGSKTSSSESVALPKPVMSAVTLAASSFSTTITPGGSNFLGTTTTTVSTFTDSIFGANTITTSSSSLFGSKPTNATPLFGVSSPSTTSVAPLFGTITSTQSSSSIFGKVIATSASTTKPSTSIFGSPALAPFAANNTDTTKSIFASNVSNSDNLTTTTTTRSIFASSTSKPLFGTNTVVVSSSASIFGNGSEPKSTSKPSSPSIFGSTSESQSSASIFGQSSSIATTKSIFGNTPTVTGRSIFGSATTPATQSQSPVFGGVSSQGSMFGSPLATVVTTQPSIFGTADTSIAQPAFGTSTSIFAATTAASTSPFGQSGTNTFGSGFGGGTAQLSVPAPVFGQQTSTFVTNSGSIFGGSQPSSTGSIFGHNTSGSSPFGTVTSSGNIFGTPVVSSSFSFASTPGESSLNFGGLNVGNTTTTASSSSSSIFGGGGSTSFASPAATVNPFGRTPEKSAFGGGTNLFATPATTASVFGSNTSFGSNNQSTFGSTTFGSQSFGQQEQQQQQQSAFGQSTFGTTSTSFGSSQPGPFSSGAAGVGQSGFGSSTVFQKQSSGFGGAPVFGGSPPPAFGGNPSFGGAPAFGAAPSFGSPTKVFGSNTATAAFGQASTGSPGFGNLANQNTIGFGNLAKQASNSPSAAFSGNSSFSSWR